MHVYGGRERNATVVLAGDTVTGRVPFTTSVTIAAGARWDAYAMTTYNGTVPFRHLPVVRVTTHG